MGFIVKECTKDNPYSQERDKSNVIWKHINALEVGEQKDGYPGGDIQRFYCPICSIEWKEELPQ